MSYRWGRAPDAGRWQRAMPVWFISFILLAFASSVGVGLYRQAFVWTPLQRFYLSAYARSALANSLGIRSGRYRVLMVTNRRVSRLAIDDEVVPVTTAAGEVIFALSELGQQAGSGRLAWHNVSYYHAGFHDYLRVWIYADQSLSDLVRPSLWAAFAVLVAGLVIGIPNDVRRARSRRHGRRLKGPELVSVRRFNRRTRADGVAFAQMPNL